MGFFRDDINIFVSIIDFDDKDMNVCEFEDESIV